MTAQRHITRAHDQCTSAQRDLQSAEAHARTARRRTVPAQRLVTRVEAPNPGCTETSHECSRSGRECTKRSLACKRPQPRCSGPCPACTGSSPVRTRPSPQRTETYQSCGVIRVAHTRSIVFHRQSGSGKRNSAMTEKFALYANLGDVCLGPARSNSDQRKVGATDRRLFGKRENE